MKYKVIARNSISIVGVMGPFDSYKTAHAEAQHLADKVGHKKDVEVLLLDEKGMKSHGIDPEVKAIEDFNAFDKSGAFGPVQLRQNSKKRNPEKSVKTYKVDGVPLVRVYRDTDYDEYSVVALSSKGRPVESSRYFADSRSDALATAERMLDEVSRKANPGHDWIGEVDQEIEDDGTEGAFTRQARRAGYKNTMEFARKVMKGWRSGKKTVYNKRTKKQQRITKKTMNRANFAINAQKRRRNPPKKNSFLTDDQFESKYGVRPGDRFTDRHGEWVVDYAESYITDPPIVTIYHADRGKGHAVSMGVSQLLDPHFYTQKRRRNPGPDYLAESFGIPSYAGFFVLQNMRDGGLAKMVLYRSPFDARQAAELERMKAARMGYNPIPVQIVPSESIPNIHRFYPEMEIAESGGFFSNPSHETPSYLQLSGPMLEEVSELTNKAKRDIIRAKTIQELYTAYYRALDQINTRWRLHTPTMRKTLKRDYAAGDKDVIAYVQKAKSLADEARALAAFASNKAWEKLDAEADARRLRAEEEMFNRHYYLLREIMGHDPELFARRNPHLVVGETAKFSDQFMQWLEKYGSQYYTPYQIEDFTQAYQTGAEFDVEAQIPGGYEVFDGNKYGGGGPERRHADESLVAGDSLSTDWPGDNFEGIPPHRTGS